jgi:hypothetical protein
MSRSPEPLAVHLPAEALARLDGLAAVEGGTRDDVARRLLLEALGTPDSGAVRRAETDSLLDVGDDVAGP